MLARLVVSLPKRFLPAVSRALFAAGAGAVEELERPSRLVVYATERAQVEALAERAAALLAAEGLAERVTLSVEVDEASRWDTAWTAHLRPVALTPRITIQPSWDETPAPAGAQRILFEPELAFGDGAHATTRLAAVAVEGFCASRGGVRVLDYGSGTGVLALVALRSGASHALGVDIDALAVRAARRNAELNGASDSARFELVADAPQLSGFELVVANLELPVLLALCDELARAAAGSERLIVTGFLAEHAAEVGAAFAERGFDLVREARAEGWALLELGLGN